MIVADETRDIPNEDIVPPLPVDLAARRNGNTRRPPRAPAGPRVPPHDLAAEASLLGACLLAATRTSDGAPVVSKAVAAGVDLGLEPKDFYRPQHGHIWAALTELHAKGAAIDAVTVADVLHRDGLLDNAGGPTYLVMLATGTPAISNAATYAGIVDEHARMRHIIGAGAELADLGYSLPADVAVAEAKAATILTFKPRASAADAYSDLDVFLDVDEPDHDWIIPGLLETADRVIITADAGTGKSTLLRQIGVMAVGGLHPFDVADIDPVNVLLLDVENSERQVRREIRPLRALIGARYEPDRFTVRVFGEAINIADPATLADLRRAVDTHQPGIILCGPLYKLIAGSPIDEEPARAVADAFDKLRHVCGSALIIEAHTPYASGSKKRELRPYGASLWERWPEYGWHFDPAGMVNHWRGQREQRAWPEALERSHPWPWAPRQHQPGDRVEGEPWKGPTRCVEAIVELLRDTGEQLSGNQLYLRLRAINPGQKGFREETVRAAAEQAAADPDMPVAVHNGANRARIFTHQTDTDLAPGDDGGMF